MSNSNGRDPLGAVASLQHSSSNGVAGARTYLKGAIGSVFRRAERIANEGQVQPPQEKPRFCQYMGNNTLLTETYFGRKIYLDSEDLSLTPHIAYEGRWEPWVTEFFVREVGQGDVFIDIGANCGFFSIL